MADPDDQVPTTAEPPLEDETDADEIDPSQTAAAATRGARGLVVVVVGLVALVVGVVVGIYLPPRRSIHLPPHPSFKEFLVSAGFGGVMALSAAVIAGAVGIYSARRSFRSQQLQLEQQGRHHKSEFAQQNRHHKAALDQQNRHYEATRADEATAAAITRCWDRLVWVVNTASGKPAASGSASASLGIGPELAREFLDKLQADAEPLHDKTLEKAVSIYRHQFGLVLLQQAGRHAQGSVPGDSGA
jgi:hypothetical protein